MRVEVMKKIFAGAALLTLAACTSADLAKVQDIQAQVSGTVQRVCMDVNAAASLAAPFSIVPQVGAILDYATASCATANAVSGMVTKALADPNTVGWLQKLAADIRAVIPRK